MSVFYSIIIPAYNAEKYIEQCIRSVLAQTCTDYEIFVIDDGSEDRTGDIIKEMAEVYPAVSFLRIPHSGAGASRNRGLRETKGKYVIFLDADDYWLNSRLLEQLRVKLETREEMRRKKGGDGACVRMPDVVMFQMDKYTEDGKLLKKY